MGNLPPGVTDADIDKVWSLGHTPCNTCIMDFIWDKDEQQWRGYETGEGSWRGTAVDTHGDLWEFRIAASPEAGGEDGCRERIEKYGYTVLTIYRDIEDEVEQEFRIWRT